MKATIEINIEDIFDNLSDNDQRAFRDYVFNEMRDAEQAEWIVEKVRYGNSAILEEVKSEFELTEIE